MFADIKNHWKLKTLNASARKFVAKFNDEPVRIRIMSDADYDARYNIDRSNLNAYLRERFGNTAIIMSLQKVDGHLPAKFIHNS